MRKKELEIILEGVEDLSEADVRSEQYMTPAVVAAELLHFAFMRGELSGVVYDLGCGTGILAIGAKLLGAKKVVGVDKDARCIEVARKNAKKLGVSVEFLCCDVRDVRAMAADVVVMNPPFGAQRSNRRADRIFLKKALEIAPIVYTIHNAGSEPFIRKFISPHVITHKINAKFPLKRRFHFHKKDVKVIEVEIYRLEGRKEREKELRQGFISRKLSN
ncbi:MAG: putative RNA methylase [Candidatus Alkanophagales archaeon MCA70_species_2]|nr:putative RNA methylase [Candidatus Alkanophaga liquidiphilum]RLG38088.1 MAG: methyltransferase [Candidatus Alkanophagales archaeon]